MKLTIIMFLCMIGSFAVANEPLWTEGKRTEERDIVVEGEVLSVKMQHKIDERENLYVATIKIIKRHKGADDLPDKIKIYYESSNTGRNIRSPRYAEFNNGMKAKFFLIKCNADCKKEIRMEKQTGIVLFIAMGSDVIKAPGQGAQPDAPKAARRLAPRWSPKPMTDLHAPHVGYPAAGMPTPV